MVTMPGFGPRESLAVIEIRRVDEPGTLAAAIAGVEV
jgi:hypothetical protein